MHEPYIVEEPTMRIVEAPSIFLREDFVESSSRASVQTWRSAAYELKYWLEFLRAIDLDWTIATVEDLKTWRDLMIRGISPHTGEVYAPNTIRTRMLTVLAFYRFAGGQGWYSGNLATHGQDLTDDRPGASAGRPCKRTRLLPRSKPKRAAIRPFSVQEWRKFETYLGPLPREREAMDLRSSRNRLIAEISLWGGLRVAETAKLEIHPFLAMTPNPLAPHAHQRLWIEDGKGGKSGWVTIPNYLVEEIVLFIQGEREDLLTDLRTPKSKRPKALFLSGRESNDPGKPLTKRRYQQIISETCIQAGLCTTREKINPEDGSTFTTTVPNHTFHDLRHTYATWTYWAERNLGNPEPWVKIKTQLRHAYVQTTIDTYIHLVEIFKGMMVPVNIRDMLGLGKQRE